MSETQLEKPSVGHPKPKRANQPPARKAQKIVAREEEHDDVHRKNQLLAMAPSWLFSFVSHLVLILVLAFWFLPLIPEKKISFESGNDSGAMDDSIDIDIDSDLQSDSEETLETEAMDADIEEAITAIPEIVELPQTDLSDFGTDFSAESLSASNAAVVLDVGNGNELSGRGPDSRRQLAKANGASGESEEAVDLALEWIVKHQLPNGSWSFDHTAGAGRFRQTPGAGIYSEAKNGATAIALLPLLGAGHTHISGKHKEAVRKGFEFLKRSGQRRSRNMISYTEPEGQLYSHGLAAIALCECYAMTNDKELEPYAQGAIKFTEYAQNPKNGGWQYQPRQGGDTSAVGWQIMALKSAKISHLETKPKTLNWPIPFSIACRIHAVRTTDTWANLAHDIVLRCQALVCSAACI